MADVRSCETLFALALTQIYNITRRATDHTQWRPPASSPMVNTPHAVVAATSHSRLADDISIMAGSAAAAVSLASNSVRVILHSHRPLMCNTRHRWTQPRKACFICGRSSCGIVLHRNRGFSNAEVIVNANQFCAASRYALLQSHQLNPKQHPSMCTAARRQQPLIDACLSGGALYFVLAARRLNDAKSWTSSLLESTVD